MVLRNRDSVARLNTLDFDMPQTPYDSGSLVVVTLLL